jgi:hypothetical protein
MRHAHAIMGADGLAVITQRKRLLHKCVTLAAVLYGVCEGLRQLLLLATLLLGITWLQLVSLPTHGSGCSSDHTMR